MKYLGRILLRAALGSYRFGLIAWCIYLLTALVSMASIVLVLSGHTVIMVVAASAVGMLLTMFLLVTGYIIGPGQPSVIFYNREK